MTNRPIGGGRNFPVRTTPTEIKILGANNFLGGLQSDLDPAEIPDNAVSDMVNMIYLNRNLYSASNVEAFITPVFDFHNILNIFAFIDATTGINLLRLSALTIYKAINGVWNILTGPALLGTDLDRYTFTVADGRGFFTNNGANVIQEFLPATLTYAPLGNAPQYRFICSAFNRVIGANLRGVTDKPYQIGWSGDLNYGQWNPLLDISAGNTPLVNSPSDLDDDITGLFSLKDSLCITRKRSIWLATNQPSATNPFFFYPDTSRVGADTPFTIKARKNGLVFYNYTENRVYHYVPGKDPIDISQDIRIYLKSISNGAPPTSYFGAYNSYLDAYHLVLSGGFIFTYHFDVERWTFQNNVFASAMDILDYATSSLTIDNLTGTIDALIGTTDNLGLLSPGNNIFYGQFDQVVKQKLYTWAPLIAGANTGLNPVSAGGMQCTIQSKQFKFPIERTIVHKIEFDMFLLQFTAPATLTIQYSTDGGFTFRTLKIITVNFTPFIRTVTYQARKLINCKSFMWKIISLNFSFVLTRYSIETEVEANSQGALIKGP